MFSQDTFCMYYVRHGKIQGQWALKKHQRAALYFTMSDIVHCISHFHIVIELFHPNEWSKIESLKNWKVFYLFLNQKQTALTHKQLPLDLKF